MSCHHCLSCAFVPLRCCCTAEDLLSEAVHSAYLQRLCQPNDFVVCMMSTGGAMAIRVVQVRGSRAQQGAAGRSGVPADALHCVGLCDTCGEHGTCMWYMGEGAATAAAAALCRRVVACRSTATGRA